MRLKTGLSLFVSFTIALSAFGLAAANTSTDSPFIASVKSFMGMEASLPASSQSTAAVNSGTGPLAPLTTSVFTTAGSTTWTAPAGVTSVTAEAWGGGGAGGSAVGTTTSRAAAGGGAGACYAKKLSIPVTPGTTYTVVVGAGGIAPTANGSAGAGGNSYFIDTATVVGTGGAGANSLATSGTDLTSAGGVGSAGGCIGDSVFAGGSGAAGASPSSASPTGYSGGAGSSAGNASIGNNAGGSTGGAAPVGGTAGANGRTSSGNAGTSATGFGAGGGGAWAAASTTQRLGGSGSAGKVILTYTAAATPAPTVTGISPGSGTTAGGTTVTINGTNLTGVSGVTFGGTAATSFTFVSDTQITAVSPAHAAGSGMILVTTPGGTSTAAPAGDFTYVAVATATYITSNKPNNTSTQGDSVTFTATVTNGSNPPAANMTWGTPTTISGDTDISTAGTLVSAQNVSGPDTTVNGVLFKTMNAAGPSADGVFTFPAGESHGDFSGFNGNGTGAFGTLSPAYQQLLAFGSYSGGPAVHNLNVNKLIPGNTYEFEYWYNDSRGGSTQNITLTSAGNAVTFAGNDVAGSVGKFVKGTFVASATTQVISIQGTYDTRENAFMLRQTASTVTLLSGKTVSFYDGACGTGSLIGSGVTDSNGNATATTTGLSVGSHTVNACFAGDASYSASNGSLNFTVNGIPTITLGATSLPDFGSVVAGQVSASKSTTLTAQYLTESINCFFPNYNFQLSTDNTNWNPQGMLIAAPGGSFNGTLYVRFSPQASTGGPVSGNIVCQTYPSGNSAKSLAVSGTDLVPPEFFVQPYGALEGRAYSYNLLYQGYPAPTCSRVGGAQMPAGLTLGSDCVITGTPAAGSMGTYVVTVKATNGVAPDAQHDVTIQVYGPPVITSANNVTVAEGKTLNFQFTATSNPQNLWQLGAGSDQLPTGVTFNGGYTGTLTGTPAFGSAGVYHLIVQANNGQTAPTNQNFTLFVTPAGPIAWWAASGDARDISGNGNDGTIVNGAGFAVGKVGQAFNLNGTSQYISAADSPSLRPTSLTLETWVNLNGLHPEHSQTILGKALGSAGSDSYVIWYQSGAFHGATCSLTTCSILDYSFSPTIRGWYHLAYTFDGTNDTLYLNGVAVATHPNSTVPQYDTHNVLIGADYPGDASSTPLDMFDGKIDEPTIFNRAITANEVASIYNAGIAGKSKSAPTPAGANVSVNAGGDATMTFANVTTSGLTQQVPIDGSGYPPVPQIPLGLYYDISSSATYTGGVTVCFHLPLVNGQATFNNLRIDHFEGGAWVDRTNTGSINFANRTVCTTSLSSLSPFAIVSLSPTAAGVMVSGRVLSPGGAGLRNATVVVTGPNGDTRRVSTNAFGTYVLDNVTAGSSYVIGVESRLYRYATRVVQVSDTLTDVDFVPEN